MRRRLSAALAATLVVAALAVAVASATSGIDWPSYLSGNAHGSSTSDATITLSNAGALKVAWHFNAEQPTVPGQPGPTFFASPTVSGSRVFIGSNTGVFYALDLTTGNVLWKRSLGFQPAKTCNAIGLVSTAAVSVDPTSGNATVYVAGGDGYLYALDAATGAVLWRAVVGHLPSTTTSDYFNWASPVVDRGEVYMGVASDCDRPFVPGGLQAFDQATGQLLSTFYTVAGQGDGGGVWTSPVLSPTGDIWVTTASGPPPPAPQGEMYSIVHLAGGTLNRLDGWTVPLSDRPGDADFASSPTLFAADVAGTSTNLVAACNKNGVLYAWPAADVSQGPLWSTRVGIGTAQGAKACLAAPVWDGQHLFYASNPTTVAGTSYTGSMRQLDPATGAALWETGLGGTVLSSPSINGNHILAAATYTVPTGGSNGTYLINSSDGSIVSFIPSTPGEFPQPVFAGGYLLLATQSGVLRAYVPRTAGDNTPPTTPTGLDASWSADFSHISFSWLPASDNKAVTAYRVFRNATMIATVSGSTTQFTDPNASAAANYAYSVEAVDATGNSSPIASPATVGRPTDTIFSDDFETGDFSRWTSFFKATVQGSVVDSGSWAARTTSTGEKSFAFATFPAENAELFVRLRFDILSHGSSSLDLLGVKTIDSQVIGAVSITKNNILQTRNVVSGVTTPSSTSVSLGSWHTLEYRINVAGPSGSSQVWLDGKEVPGLTITSNYGSNLVGLTVIGDQHLSRSFDVAYDNFTVDASP